MNQQNEDFVETITRLSICYIIHIVFYIFIVLLHYIAKGELFFSKDIMNILFYIAFIILCMFTVYPLAPLLYLKLKKYTSTSVNKVQKITKILLISSIGVSVIMIAVLWINSVLTVDFYKECSFNYSKEDIYNINSDFNGSDFSETSREEVLERLTYCFFYKENVRTQIKVNKFAYLCNTDISYKFGDNIKDIISCSDGKNKLNYDEYKWYYDNYFQYISLGDVYYCSRAEKHKEFKISRKYKCPLDTYKSTLFIFPGLFTVMDFIFIFIVWYIEYLCLEDVVNLYLQEGRDNQHIGCSSLNSTVNSSHVKNIKENDSFEKEDTFYIFINQGDRNILKAINQANQANQESRNKNTQNNINCSSSITSNPNKSNFNTINADNGNNEILNPSNKEVICINNYISKKDKKELKLTDINETDKFNNINNINKINTSSDLCTLRDNKKTNREKKEEENPIDNLDIHKEIMNENPNDSSNEPINKVDKPSELRSEYKTNNEKEKLKGQDKIRRIKSLI